MAQLRFAATVAKRHGCELVEAVLHIAYPFADQEQLVERCRYTTSTAQTLPSKPPPA